MSQYKTLELIQKNPNSPIIYIYLNRPHHRNALTLDFFTELPRALSSIDQDPNIRVIILAGAGDHFCSGIDIRTFTTITDQPISDRARANEKLRREIKDMQEAITAIEKCRKPVIASINGGCIGGGIDIITACDIRFCSKDSFFSVKEVDLALAADLGTLQRLPGIVGFGNAMELGLTGRRFSGQEAKDLGLVSRVFTSKKDLEENVWLIAEEIAVKSPLAVAGTKAVLLRSRDLNLEQGLDYVATWNSSMLVSGDLKEAVKAYIQKRKPVFAKL